MYNLLKLIKLVNNLEIKKIRHVYNIIKKYFYIKIRWDKDGNITPYLISSYFNTKVFPLYDALLNTKNDIIRWNDFFQISIFMCLFPQPCVFIFFIYSQPGFSTSIQLVYFIFINNYYFRNIF